MKYHFSKIAKEEYLNDVVKKYLTTVWRPDRGFFENLLPIVSYLPLLGPIKIVPFLLTAFGAHMLDMSPSKLGRWLDDQVGTGPGESASIDEVTEKLYTAFSSALKEKTAKHISSRHLTKEASIWSAIGRGLNVPKAFAVGLRKMIVIILGLFGVATIDQFLEQVGGVGRDITGLPGIPEVVQEKIDTGKLPDVSEIVNKTTKTEDDIDSMIDKLQKKYNLK